MVKNTAIRMRVTSAPMSPICLAKPTANSFSGWVLVSSGEFAKRSSIAAEMALAWLESAMRSMYQPVLPRVVLARLVEVGDVDEDHVGVAAHGRVLGVDARPPGRTPSSGRRRSWAWISELIGSVCPIFQPKRSTRRTPATAPVRVAREGLALRGRDGELRVHREIALGIHREDGKGVALVLVLGAEPVGVGDAHHARHLLDAA